MRFSLCAFGRGVGVCRDNVVIYSLLRLPLPLPLLLLLLPLLHLEKRLF